MGPAREKAKTQPFPTSAVAMLTMTRKKPQWNLSDGTIWHGPSFKNLAMPSDPEKAEMQSVIKNMTSLEIPRKLYSSPPIIVFPSLKAIAKRINVVGTASKKGSKNKAYIFSR